MLYVPEVYPDYCSESMMVMEQRFFILTNHLLRAQTSAVRQQSRHPARQAVDELNLLRESANAIQLRRNFEDSPMLYVPEVYPDYCSDRGIPG
jgi:predicted unusual protein kinase regulating ubiquinone biosynthesis (AarF/ABC1/UbiB family)